MKIIQLLLTYLLIFGTSILANNIATVTAIKGSATIIRNGSNIDAKLGSSLQEKDSIKTHENTKVQLIFADETIISLGKNSDFSIKKYLFEDGKESIAKFGMIKGAMRAITGKIGKITPQRFSVSTKTATIGIRGTNFSIIIGTDGSHQVFCSYGKITVTYNGKTNIVQQGYLIDISSTGEVEVKEFNPEILKEMKTTRFGVTKNKFKKLVKEDTYTENEEQLDVTINDTSALTIQNLTENTTDGIQKKDGLTVEEVEEMVKSLSELLLSYTMNDALYTGTFNVTGGTYTDLNPNGEAQLKIDFGHRTLELRLDPTGTNAVFNQPVENHNIVKFDVGQQNGLGQADGTFTGPTGNDVSGNFNYTDINGNSSGNYNVTSSQALH